MKKIIDFVSKHLKVNPTEITSVEKVTTGFTNEIYHVKLRDQKEYKVRFATTNPFINRSLERFIEEQLFKNDIFYYDDEGNFIKKWYIGETLSKEKLNDEVWENIISVINKLQTLQPTNIDVSLAVYVLYDHEVPQHLIRHLWAYKKIIAEEIETNAKVLCHNDFSCNNTIVFDNNITLMDFEWATYNHPYWDVANLIKDLELNYEEVKSIKCLQSYRQELLFKTIYATHFFTYFWTYKVAPTKAIVDYRNQIIERIFYWYNILKENNWAHKNENYKSQN